MEEKEGPNIIIQPYNPQYILPKMTTDKKFTLVLDLDETLIHFNPNKEKAAFFIWPFAEEFIEEMHSYFEIVIFTAAVK